MDEFVKCATCGGRYLEEDCVYFHDDSVYVCDEDKWQYIDNRFDHYLIQNNIAQKVKELAANPTLEAVTALLTTLEGIGSDWEGKPADTNDVGCVVGPLYDIQTDLKKGDMSDLPLLFRELQEGIDEATHPPIT